MSELFHPPTLLEPNRWRGMRIGLLGGSFNPAHEGHVHISKVALSALRLDCVWWLVSPQNPLKSTHETAPYAERVRGCIKVLEGFPRIIVSDLERQLGTTRTFDTLGRMIPHFPDVSLVWLSGLDNAMSMHDWYRWKGILGLMATAHIARPPALTLVRNAPLKLLSGQNQVYVNRSIKADLSPGNTYWIVERRMNGQSSTHLRRFSSRKKLFAPWGRSE